MKYSVSLERLDGFIFDLDGVIADTARLHADAWKRMFDEYLEERSRRSATPHKPFQESDYRIYVDGKPRYLGVKDFLGSRGISIPFGDKNDRAGTETICGLGNLKNDYFQEILGKKGPELYPSSVDFIRKIRAKGIKTAIISSSRNCAQILRTLKIEGLFDAKVDGVDLEDLGIPGKPDPSMFLEAVKRIRAEPRRVAIVEDSLAGVEAGRRGRFALVVGIDRAGYRNKMKELGADVVVNDVGDLELNGGESDAVRSLPSALDSSAIGVLVDSKRIAVFLDYDGTLTEIVEDPTKALISEETRLTLRRLASLCTVAVLSGRDLEDVKNLVNVENIVYAGCHGFDIMTSDGKRLDNPQWLRFLPSLDRAERELRSAMKGIPGVIVERKRFAISVHYRKVDESNLPEVEARFSAVASNLPELRRTGGKKVFELLPNVAWNKGAALASLLEMLGLEGEETLPIFMGDDLTDEDAFKVLRDTGLAILVGEVDRATHARFTLSTPLEVRQFLESLIDVLKAMKA